MLQPLCYLFLRFAPSIVQEVTADVHDLDVLALNHLEVSKNLVVGLLYALEFRQV